MCYGDRSRQRTDKRTAIDSEETEETVERNESPSKGIVAAPVRALKQAYALIA